MNTHGTQFIHTECDYALSHWHHQPGGNQFLGIVTASTKPYKNTPTNYCSPDAIPFTNMAVRLIDSISKSLDIDS